MGLLSRLFGRRQSTPPRPDTEPRREPKVRLSPDGLPITEFSGPITQMLRLYGFGGTYAAMYVRQPHIRTVVDGIARECAELSLKMYEKVPRGPQRPSDRLEIPDHRMMELLHEPSPGMAEARFWFALFADISIYDIAHWLKIRTVADGPPEALIRVPPANLVPWRNPITGNIDYWYDAAGNHILPQNLVTYWGYDPSINHGNVAPMESLRQLLASEFAAELNREGMWKNALRKDGVIEPAVDSREMSDEARESYLVDLEDSLSGSAGTSRPALLLPGHKWNDAQWNPREMEYVTSRKLARTEVAAAFHVPPAWVAAASNNVEPNENTLTYLYKSSLPPILKRVEDEIEAQLLPDFDRVKTLRQRRYVKFNLDQKLRGDPEMQMKILATAVGGPIASVNEGRSRVDLPPTDDPEDDLIWKPLNSVRGSGPQVSPQSPTATPAQGLEPVGTTPGGGTAPEKGESAEEVLEQHEEKIALARVEAAHEVFVREVGARYEERYENVLQKFMDRQRNTVRGGKELKRQRWDKELADDLHGVMFDTANAFGNERAGDKWEPERAYTLVRAEADQVAKLINDHTVEMLAREDADLDEVFGRERVAELAKTGTLWTMNWSINQAAKTQEIVA